MIDNFPGLYCLRVQTPRKLHDYPAIRILQDYKPLKSSFLNSFAWQPSRMLLESKIFMILLMHAVLWVFHLPAIMKKENFIQILLKQLQKVIFIFMLIKLNFYEPLSDVVRVLKELKDYIQFDCLLLYIMSQYFFRVLLKAFNRFWMKSMFIEFYFALFGL